MIRRLGTLLILVSGTFAQDTPPARIIHEIGSRSVLVDFAVDESDKATQIDIVASEVAGLEIWAKSIIRAGQLKPGSPGVTKISEMKYRAMISFPVKDDGAPLAAGITLPTASKAQAVPVFPYEMSRNYISGGALLKLSIDRNAKVKKVELVRTSHPSFGRAALEGVKKWRFDKPAQKDGATLDLILHQLIVFNIEGKTPASWEWQIAPEPALPTLITTGSFIPLTPELLEKLRPALEEQIKKH
jgi:TonB family protein